MKKNKAGFTPLEINKKRGGLSLTGFTLLELLIAVTIFSITALALYSSFHAGIRILQRAEEAMRLHQELRGVMEEVSLDLRNSLLFPIYQEKKRPETPSIEEEAEPVYFFLGEAKKFTFITLKDSFLGDGGLKRQIGNVTYYLEDKDTKKLMRIIKYQGKGFTAKPTEEEILLTNIEDIEIQYSYKADEEDSPPVWLNWWEEEEKVPLGVKIKLKLKGWGRLREFTKTVFIPIGTLGLQGEEPPALGTAGSEGL